MTNRTHRRSPHIGHISTALLLGMLGAVGATSGCRKESARPHSAGTSNPRFFSLMTEGTRKEAARDFNAAIGLYREAEADTPNVDSSIRNKAKVSVHNRIGTAYVKLGEFAKARAEFKLSQSLGDSKFAPRVLERLASSTDQEFILSGKKVRN